MSKRIGSIIKIKEDINIKKIVSGQDRIVKAGTTAVVNSDGDLYILTGTEQNTILNQHLEVYGYDHTSIAELIFRRLNLEIDLGDILEESDFSNNDCIEIIESVLEDIL